MDYRVRCWVSQAWLTSIGTPTYSFSRLGQTPAVERFRGAMVRDSFVNQIPINIPNSLTVLRILLVPVFVGLLLYGYYGIALVTFIAAALTDGLDGAIARRTNQRTRLGEYLDPLADKIMVMSAFVTLAVLHFIPLWAVILVVSRDAILLIGTMVANLAETAIDISPTVLGKGTTFTQVSYVLVVVMFAMGWVPSQVVTPVLYSMVGLTIGSGGHYLYRGIQYLNSSGDT